jgi:GxxExxY protein
MTIDNRDPQTYAIIGAAMEVHRELGCGFREPVYREPFAIELQARGIPFEREVKLPITYKGQRMPLEYQADFICCGEVLVELKALTQLGALEDSQVINYLRAADLQRGLLINFGARSLQYRRLIWTPSRQPWVIPVKRERGEEQSSGGTP